MGPDVDAQQKFERFLFDVYRDDREVDELETMRRDAQHRRNPSIARSSGE